MKRAPARSLSNEKVDRSSQAPDLQNEAEQVSQTAQDMAAGGRAVASSIAPPAMSLSPKSAVALYESPVDDDLIAGYDATVKDSIRLEAETPKQDLTTDEKVNLWEDKIDPVDENSPTFGDYFKATNDPIVTDMESLAALPDEDEGEGSKSLYDKFTSLLSSVAGTVGEAVVPTAEASSRRSLRNFAKKLIKEKKDAQPKTTPRSDEETKLYMEERSKGILREEVAQDILAKADKEPPIDHPSTVIYDKESEGFYSDDITLENRLQTQDPNLTRDESSFLKQAIEKSKYFSSMLVRPYDSWIRTHLQNTEPKFSLLQPYLDRATINPNRAQSNSTVTFSTYTNESRMLINEMGILLTKHGWNPDNKAFQRKLADELRSDAPESTELGKDVRKLLTKIAETYGVDSTENYFPRRFNLNSVTRDPVMFRSAAAKSYDLAEIDNKIRKIEESAAERTKAISELESLSKSSKDSTGVTPSIEEIDPKLWIEIKKANVLAQHKIAALSSKKNAIREGTQASSARARSHASNLYRGLTDPIEIATEKVAVIRPDFHRKFGKDADTVLADFYEDDLGVIFGEYIHRTVRTSAVNYVLGDAPLTDVIENLHKEGVSSRSLKEFKEYMNEALGFKMNSNSIVSLIRAGATFSFLGDNVFRQWTDLPQLIAGAGANVRTHYRNISAVVGSQKELFASDKLSPSDKIRTANNYGTVSNGLLNPRNLEIASKDLDGFSFAIESGQTGAVGKMLRNFYENSMLGILERYKLTTLTPAADGYLRQISGDLVSTDPALVKQAKLAFKDLGVSSHTDAMSLTKSILRDEIADQAFEGVITPQVRRYREVVNRFLTKHALLGGRTSQTAAIIKDPSGMIALATQFSAYANSVFRHVVLPSGRAAGRALDSNLSPGQRFSQLMMAGVYPAYLLSEFILTRYSADLLGMDDKKSYINTPTVDFLNTVTGGGTLGTLTSAYQMVADSLSSRNAVFQLLGPGGSFLSNAISTIGTVMESVLSQEKELDKKDMANIFSNLVAPTLGLVVAGGVGRETFARTLTNRALATAGPGTLAKYITEDQLLGAKKLRDTTPIMTFFSNVTDKMRGQSIERGKIEQKVRDLSKNRVQSLYNAYQFDGKSLLAQDLNTVMRAFDPLVSVFTPEGISAIRAENARVTSQLNAHLMRIAVAKRRESKRARLEKKKIDRIAELESRQQAIY